MQHEMNLVLQEVQKVIIGKKEAISKVLMALLAEGHILLDDVPGVGKTTLAVALSRAMGLTHRRIQFTPDALPSDIVGFSMYDRESGSFVYHPGVLAGTNLLLGDEINRTSSKTQSALLEAMEEGQITVDGQTMPLESPFTVIATENRIGTAGTQLLPYAQLDRFMVRLTLGYPAHEAQVALLRDRLTRNPLDEVQPVLTRDELAAMQQAVREVTVRDSILDYIARMSEASRADGRIEVGISPRGALCVLRMSKAHAWLKDRDYVTGGDVQAVFEDVCGHRVLLSRNARMEGLTAGTVLKSLLNTVPSPDQRA